MIVAFSGRGWAIGVISFSSLLFADYAASTYFHDAEYYAQHGWTKLGAFVLAAAVVQAFLSGREEEIDSKTGEVIRKPRLLRKNDALFFIPSRFWPVILILCGVAFFATAPIRP